MAKPAESPEWFITPDWPAPANVRALITTRNGGLSDAPYDSLNLGFHVNDKASIVKRNWENITINSELQILPQLLSQVHGSRVIQLPYKNKQPPEADGAYTSEPNTPCAILTADCLPVLLCDKGGTQVAALHAGWRGLAAGVLNQGVATFEHPDNIVAYLGPAICPACFEVGEDVVTAFIVRARSWGKTGVAETEIRQCFQQVDTEHWLADLYQLARLCLNACGVSAIFGGEFCTLHQPKQFFSYRRDGVTGRMASIIWLTES